MSSPIFRPNLLAGQAALITGGGTGLGFGIAHLLATLGCDICIVSRNATHLEPAAERLRVHGGRVLAIEANVRDPASIRAAVDRANAEFGRLDILVNNAAGNFYAPSETLSPNGWKAVVETDLYGTFFGCQAVYAHMKRNGGGRIISISMTLHYRGWPMMAHATAAKAGVDALTKTLALEWSAANITVNAVAPGPIPTEGVRKAFARPGDAGSTTSGSDTASIQQLQRDIPLKRTGTPEDIANIVAYLAGPGGDWITGSIFVVDGGGSLSST